MLARGKLAGKGCRLRAPADGDAYDDVIVLWGDPEDGVDLGSPQPPDGVGGEPEEMGLKGEGHPGGSRIETREGVRDGAGSRGTRQVGTGEEVG